MARPLRIEFPGAGHRVIFNEDPYRSLFLEPLGELNRMFRVEIHAFCLMGNHYHLLIHTPEANLGVECGIWTVSTLNVTTGQKVQTARYSVVETQLFCSSEPAADQSILGQPPADKDIVGYGMVVRRLCEQGVSKGSECLIHLISSTLTPWSSLILLDGPAIKYPLMEPLDVALMLTPLMFDFTRLKSLQGGAGHPTPLAYKILCVHFTSVVHVCYSFPTICNAVRQRRNT